MMESNNTRRIAIVGGGPAGSMAAIAAADAGAAVDLFEKNGKIGRKLYITGKGRCNVTNAAPHRTFLEHVVRNPRFLYRAFARFDNVMLMRFLEGEGLTLKVERGERVFPASDKSSDVIRTLQRGMERRGVRIHFSAPVRHVQKEHGGGFSLVTEESAFRADRVILACGGLSYPSTGSTGDGYAFARQMGHTCTNCSPSLVAFELKEPWIKCLEGLSLRNVQLLARVGTKKFSAFGEAVFTARGISGPIVLRLSADLSGGPAPDALQLNWKPALTAEQLHRRLLREIEAAPRKGMRAIAETLLPKRFVPFFLETAALNPTLPANQLSRGERQRFCDMLQAFPLHFQELGSFREAVVTRGGIPTREVHPESMESKVQQGLYLCGEMLDVDALTGGFNLQIAFTTGYVAGQSAAQKKEKEK